MRKQRYWIGQFGGVKHITDSKDDRVFAYGYGVELPTHQEHRRTYTDNDARAVVDWLNSRKP